MINPDLVRAIVVEPAPCSGCQFAERCRDERLACDAFALYSQSAQQSRWCNAPRAPTPARFESLFDD